MNKIFIGIDNGVTGAISILDYNGKVLYNSATPVIKQQNYTKTKQNLNRLDFKKTIDIFEPFKDVDKIVLIERPMVNPQRYKATLSAIRCLEATLNVLEYLDMPYQYIDSKEWQKALLPSGLKKEELKKGSTDIGLRLFPEERDFIVKQKDADSLLIAEYARRKNL